MAKSIWTVVRVLVAIVGALLLCLSGVLDIQKIRGHYPAKALLMEDYAPPSPATTVTHTVTITRPAPHRRPFRFSVLHRPPWNFLRLPLRHSRPKVYQQNNEPLIPVLQFSVKSVQGSLMLRRN